LRHFCLPSNSCTSPSPPHVSLDILGVPLFPPFSPQKRLSKRHLSNPLRNKTLQFEPELQTPNSLAKPTPIFPNHRVVLLFFSPPKKTAILPFPSHCYQITWDTHQTFYKLVSPALPLTAPIPTNRSQTFPNRLELLLARQPDSTSPMITCSQSFP